MTSPYAQAGPRDLRPDPATPALENPAAQDDDNAQVRWDWCGQSDTEGAYLARAVGEFVAFVNTRYAWTRDHTVPPCWADHGALVEELTTLMWSRWAAFQGPLAAPEAAQTWHTYHLPAFLGRVGYWLGGPDAAADCRSGHHQASRLHPTDDNGDTDPSRDHRSGPRRPPAAAPHGGRGSDRQP